LAVLLLSFVVAASATVTWTWMAGSNHSDEHPVYVGSNVYPGSRQGHVSFRLPDGRVAVGFGESQDTTRGDLFAFSEQTSSFGFLMGDTRPFQRPVYGEKGVASDRNDPGARSLSSVWAFGKGAYLFGGESPRSGGRSDMWKLDGSQWTWVSGSNHPNEPGNYSATSAATPGARDSACVWSVTTNSHTLLYLYGGFGYDADYVLGFMSDLWVFDTAAQLWTFVAGSQQADANPSYSNDPSPGGRSGSVCWISGGSLMLYGGYAFNNSYLADLWTFDLSAQQWKFVGGHKRPNVVPVYGSFPGSRAYATAWTLTDTLYLFGGKVGDQDVRGDLWSYSGDKWAYLSGVKGPNASPVYGQKGVPSSTSDPGARAGTTSFLSTASSSRAFVYGGSQRADLWAVDIA